MKTFIKRVLVIAAVLLVLSVFNLRMPFIFVNGISMYPTYEDGQRVNVSYNTAKIQRGDVVIFKEHLHSSSFKERLIKRVCGVGGDLIYQDPDGIFFVLNEGNIYYYEPNSSYISSDELLSKSTLVYELSSNELFCMGDNRDESVDCRDFGPINSNEILAIVKDGNIIANPFIF